MKNEKDREIARRLAKDVQNTFPVLFRDVPVRVTKVARALGIAIELRADLDGRAYIQVLEEQGLYHFKIFIKPNLSPPVGRFAVAHEIGHAVLVRANPDSLHSWDKARQESFANVFAAELLVPCTLREQYGNSFRNIEDVEGLLRLAGQLGLSIGATLHVADEEQAWTKGSNHIWLSVRRSRNSFTLRDEKLRIVGATYDRGKYYVPRNMSIRSMIGEDGWLCGLRANQSAVRDYELIISTITGNPYPKYSRVLYGARFHVRRLPGFGQHNDALIALLVMGQEKTNAPNGALRLNCAAASSTVKYRSIGPGNS